MRLITVMDDRIGVSVRRAVSPDELATLSGVQLAALLFPEPTTADITLINDFLDKYRNGAR